jgi:hypothetical protein
MHSGTVRIVVAAKGVIIVSIVRVGLAETRNFATGYDAIFGGKPSAGKSAGPKGKSAKSGKSKSKKKKK